MIQLLITFIIVLFTITCCKKITLYLINGHDFKEGDLVEININGYAFYAHYTGVVVESRTHISNMISDYKGCVTILDLNTNTRHSVHYSHLKKIQTNYISKDQLKILDI